MNEPHFPTEAPGSEADARRGRLPVCVLVLMLVGAGLRLYRIDAAEMWSDEITYVLWAEKTLPEFFELASEGGHPHLPAYPQFLKLFILAFGHGETVYRLSAFFPGVFSILLVYLVGRALLTEEAGVIAAGLLTFSTGALYVSQEVAPYSFIAMLSLLCTWSFFRAKRSKRFVDWAVFAVCGVLATYTYLFLILVLGCLYLVFGVEAVLNLVRGSSRKDTWNASIKAAVAGIVIAAAFTPVVRHALHAVAPENASKWGGASAFSFIETWAMVIRLYVFDRPVSAWLFLAFCVLGLPMVSRKPTGWFTCALLAASIGLPLYLIHSQGYTFRARHYSYAMPFLVLCMSCGVVSIRRVLGLLVRQWKGAEVGRFGGGLLLATAFFCVPAARGLYQFYLVRGTQSCLHSYEVMGDVEPRLLKPGLKLQLYSKTKAPPFREMASVVYRSMKRGDILILDGGDDIGRNLVFHLRRRFRRELPVDSLRSLPQATDYEPGSVSVMLSYRPTKILASLENQSIPEGGVRVFRVTARYLVGEIPGTSSLEYPLCRIGVSSERFADRAALAEYLRMHASFTRASDLAQEAEALGTAAKQAEAERLLRESMALFETSRAASALGVILTRQGHVDEAEPLLEMAAHRRRDRWDYWWRLAKVRAQQDRIPQAIEAAHFAASLPKVSPWVFRDLAEMHVQQRDYGKARQAYAELAARLDEPGYLVAAAQTYVLEGQPERALENTLAILRAHPDHGGAHLYAAQLYDQLGRTRQAYPHVVKAVGLRPDDIATIAWCVELHLTFGEREKALGLLERAVKRHPDNGKLAEMLDQVGGQARRSQQR